MTKRRTSRKAPATEKSEQGEQRRRALVTAEASFPIVGVGASAGGLEAFTQLLKHLPVDTGMGFVLVQHLDPEHDSALSQLLARATTLTVNEVTDQLRVESNNIYVIPPNASLSISSGVLALGPRGTRRSPQRSIDHFFESLAQDQHERAIGVVLSGTASDGTLGLEAIKAEGGITFAQDESARYDSMPRSAIAAGCVDFVMSPESIARELGRIAKHPIVVAGAGGPWPEDHEAEEQAKHTPSAGASDAERKPPKGDAAEERVEGTDGSSAAALYRKILLTLRNHSGVDFSLYKPSTIRRRLSRRMVLTKHTTLEEYLAHLKGNATEREALYTDALISVTSFFRNPEAFDVLQHKVFPQLLERRTDEPLRIWVLGCSTGQEAYSLAMTFMEAADKAPRARKLQVFATDLNDNLLDKARHGHYPPGIAADVSPQRLRRFFTEEEGGYQVVKSLRAMVVFARQNLIADPPFSRLDLISCRNLLIYLDASMQRKVMPTFHYALKPGGFLFLGASESTGTADDLFEPVDKRHKIYTRKAGPVAALHLPDRKEAADQSASKGRPHADAATHLKGVPRPEAPELTALREADRVAVNRFAPPAVLVNDELQILQFRGPTAAFLEPPTGRATFDVLKMAREGLMLPLRATINKAKKENKVARKDDVRMRQNGTTRIVSIEVIPLRNLRERCFLIVFEERGRQDTSRRKSSAPATEREKAASRKGESARLAELETELTETRDYLQSLQEQHEAANEELQAANEEVQSANEELQSINEELETSKEELESANEELTTVNEEMANRNTDLNRLNNDLANLQMSTRLPIVLLGRDLRIRRFSAAAEKQLGLMSMDVGRPVGEIRHGMSGLDLSAVAREVIDSVREVEQEVRDASGCWFVVRARPYLTLDNKLEGAVIVLIDIDELKRTQQEVSRARDFADNIIDTLSEPLLVLDEDLRVERANQAFYEYFTVDPATTLGRFIHELGNGQWNIPELRTMLLEMLATHTQLHDFRVDHSFESLGPRSMLLNARPMRGPGGGILLAIEDVTDRLAIEGPRNRLAAIVRSSEDAIISKDLNGTITTWNAGAVRLFGYTADEAIGQPGAMLISPDRADEEPHIVARIRRGESIDHYETVRRRKDGSFVDVSLTVSPILDGRGTVVGASKIARDISRQKALEQSLLEADRRKNEFIAVLAHELRNPLAPIRNALHFLQSTAGQNAALIRSTDMMQRQLRVIVRLVDDLLDVGRISTGKIELRREWVDLNTLVPDAVEAARALVRDGDREISLVTGPDPIRLYIDPERVAQVIGNIVNNACKFTGDAGRIVIAVERNETEAVIRVRDNGIGIRREKLGMIFDMFEQVDRSLERTDGGLGIGLALAQTLVELHEGTIEAKSEGTGQGSEFIVRLPLSRGGVEVADAGRPPPMVSGRRILVVDDNKDAASSLAALVGLTGNETRTAYDGESAIEAAGAFRPDVMLLDIGLPKMNGYEVCRRIRAESWGSALTIVALTGWGQADDMRRSTEAGFDGHLVKPVELSALARLLVEVDGRHRGRGRDDGGFSAELRAE